MIKTYRPLVVALMVASLLVSGCGPQAEATATEENHNVTVEQLSGKVPTRETLSADAAKRLGIQTMKVGAVQVDGTSRTVIPYDAIIYDTQGATWVYLNAAPLTFERHPITVDHIQGDQAFLSDSLPSDSAVVTVGAIELYGAEVEFEEE